MQIVIRKNSFVFEIILLVLKRRLMNLSRVKCYNVIILYMTSLLNQF